ncbi:AraC family transcriptional regulator [Actibacterium sp. 188UL27-1]|uniref:helix-turn-helix domain-containing protein n=1 Tax=Actibacterium sp. 188UL27-1 TaxID=2786961 RepID=UPI00195E0C28|nr:AraC family transcriptional regulator [Actibacterium sp. 188UL27-1]MBM7069577.1 helix-turn-helix transcriptional regulator [Actibacterium sp. 188UL27-1]
MPDQDRLSALMSRFSLRVTVCAGAEANFVVRGDQATAQPQCMFLSRAPIPELCDGHAMLQARVNWGGADNPLLAALPQLVRHDLTKDPTTAALAGLLVTEHRARRCGANSVLNRLGEVLLVHLLRGQIERGSVEPGLLGGLADPRLSRAIVALHDDPGRPWPIEAMAQNAGLSVSRFAELFRGAVGETPSAYLRKWRLTLAKQDIERGDRVGQVARRYGYGSTEALGRACQTAFGATPMNLRKAARSNDQECVG